MLTLAVENPGAASGNIFNCVSDRAVTLDGMAKLCAKAAGLPVEIVHYDPKAIGVDAKKAFPFRNMVWLSMTKQNVTLYIVTPLNFPSIPYITFRIIAPRPLRSPTFAPRPNHAPPCVLLLLHFSPL